MVEVVWRFPARTLPLHMQRRGADRAPSHSLCDRAPPRTSARCSATRVAALACAAQPLAGQSKPVCLMPHTHEFRMRCNVRRTAREALSRRSLPRILCNSNQASYLAGQRHGARHSRHASSPSLHTPPQIVACSMRSRCASTLAWGSMCACRATQFRMVPSLATRGSAPAAR